MADSEKQKLSQKERQLEKIEKLKKQLEQEEAKLRSQARKERDGQLIALGIFLEEYFKDKPGRIPSMKQAMEKLLTGRNLERALAGVERISELLKKDETDLKEMSLEQIVSGSPEKEISPEPPSQLPDAEAQEKNQGSA